MRRFLRRASNLGQTLLRQGISRDKLALSIGIGLVVGIFPVLGATTVLCTFTALALRLNLLAVHGVHYAATPLRLVLIIPFVRVGEHLLGAAPQPLSIQAGLALIDEGAMAAVIALWDAIVHAVLGWLLLAPLLLALVHVLSLCLLARFARMPDKLPQTTS